MEKTALIVMSDGFEDIETVVPIDVLTRLGVRVIIAGLNSRELKGAWGSTLLADLILDEVQQSYDALILPGGKKNALSLASSPLLRQSILDYYNGGKIVAAICASPSHVLGEAAQLLKGKRATGDPAFNDRLERTGAILTHEAVTVDGNIITAQGPGAAFAFAFAIGQVLKGSSELSALAEKWQLCL